MRAARFAPASKLLLLLALAGFVLGCGEQMGSGPVPTKEESKKIAEEMKKSMREQKAARAQAAKEGRAGGPR
jgi:hypothetical protein